MKGLDNFTYDELFQMAFTDELTQLPNYRKFKYGLQDLFEISRLERKTFAVIFMDINHFKQVNDQYGHSTGDKLLVKCSSLLAKIANIYDEEVFRKSGDEFLFIVKDLTNLFYIINDIQHVLKRPLYINKQAIRCEFSIGYSIYPIHGKSEEELIDYADQKMYGHKEHFESVKY